MFIVPQSENKEQKLILLTINYSKRSSFSQEQLNYVNRSFFFLNRFCRNTVRIKFTKYCFLKFFLHFDIWLTKICSLQFMLMYFFVYHLFICYKYIVLYTQNFQYFIYTITNIKHLKYFENYFARSK